MKLKFCLLLSIICVAVSSCYDDSAIWDSIKDHESRISKLEILCGQLNTNITSIQEIIASIKNNENASNISPIMENDKVIGYTIAFLTASQSLSILQVVIMKMLSDCHPLE